MGGARNRTGKALKRIGLLGGSFNPAHGGHRRISLFAQQALGLDEVWWLVSPGNPLKPKAGMAPLAARLASANRMAKRAPIVPTQVERELGTRYTIDTLRKLAARYPKHRFVWLMGADNLGQFHRWERWEDILRMVPVGVLARPGWGVRGRMSKAARIYGGHRVDRGEVLRLRAAPCWCFVNLPMDGSSSSAIRARGEWRG